MKEFKAIKTVYSYLLPEVREVARQVFADWSHIESVLLSSIDPGLEDFQESTIFKLCLTHAGNVPHLSQFPNVYPTMGSEEAIREYLNLLSVQGTDSIFVIKDDYEGFKAVAETRGITTIPVDLEQNLNFLKPGHWLLSNPSARNGMLLPDGFIHDLCSLGHKVFYDLSYLGATGPVSYNLDYENISAAAISFSKLYGLFFLRIGFVFSREPIPVLYGNKMWFKHIPNLILAEKLLELLDLAAIAAKYKKIQVEIIEEINHNLGLGLRASDVFLLAHLSVQDAVGLDDNQLAMIAPFKRGNHYRFCLTPYFQLRENK